MCYTGICCSNTSPPPPPPPTHTLSEASVLSLTPFSVQGYALIEYEKFEEAQAAIKELDGAELYEQKMSVDWAFSSGPAKRRFTRKRSPPRARSRTPPRRRH
ncbi:RNA-binding protein 8A [Zea mays]|uniref:RNA-binding protein 8A n=1 Tax=Zea mays TaxID=4577 RepID=A0A1D6J1U3_MAIZE|nr:RNA-binding protein 8A [Zea mays]